MSEQEHTIIPENYLRHLKEVDPRFVLNSRGAKKPYKLNWGTRKNAYEATSTWFEKRLAAGENYGVLCGHGLVVIDGDTPEIIRLVEEKLPQTLTVKSGRDGAGYHYYFKCEWDHDTGVINFTRNNEELGGARGPKHQAIGPGSLHPSGRRYKVHHDLPLAEITTAQIRDIFRQYIGQPTTNIKQHIKRVTEHRDEFKIPIMRLIDTSNMRERGDEYYGVHPIHGSDTGHNFWVHPDKNAWYCFRCKAGGGPLQWLAVEMGVIECKQAKPGALDGAIFLRVKEEAIKRGLIDSPEEEKVEPLPYKDTVTLYNEIKEYFEKHLDLMESIHYDILTAWTFATWNIAKLDTIAYLLFRGMKKSGKTRALDTLEGVCYNPENCALISSPAIYRILNEKATTFFIDEFDNLHPLKLQALLPILNAGYQRGKYAVICDKDDPSQILRLPCFGAKAIALIKGTDDAFTSRCIYIPMYKNAKSVNFRIDKEKASELKSKLKQWQEDTKDTPPIYTEDVYLKEKNVKDYRIIQLFEPLTSSIPPIKRENLYLQAQKEAKEDTDDEMDEIYKDLYTIITTIYGEGTGDKLITVKEIGDAYNKDKFGEEKLEPIRVGSLLKTMGFKKKHTKTGSARTVNAALLKRMGYRFNPEKAKNPQMGDYAAEQPPTPTPTPAA